MSHRDSWLGTRGLDAGLLKVAVLWLFRGLDWSSIRWRADCTWSPRLLAAATLLWVWSDESNLGTRFVTARKIALFLSPSQEKVAGSYQAFIKLLVRWTPGLAALIQVALRHAPCKPTWRRCGVSAIVCSLAWVAARSSCRATKSNQKAYAAAWRTKKKNRKSKLKKRRSRRGDAGIKKAQTPQLTLTTLWHVGSGLPWSWRIGGSYVGERSQVARCCRNCPKGPSSPATRVSWVST